MPRCERFGGLDIVVNNAGTTHRNRPMLEVDEATFDRVYAVNVKSIYWMAQAAVPVLRAAGARRLDHQHQLAPPASGRARAWSGTTAARAR